MEDTTKLEEKTVLLDGVPVTQEQLQEARQKKNVKVVENGENSYKSLKRLLD